MMTVTATTCARHDTIGGACSQESNTLRYGFHTKHQHACVENFLLAHSWRGMGKRDMTSNINWFMNVPVEADGTLGIVDGISAPGLVARSAGGDGRARRDLELPADQQPVQRLRPDADPPRGHPLTRVKRVGSVGNVTKVLVANRGEIACRIIRTLDRLGIESVAVYSDADRGALHVGMADEAVRIGPAPAAASYLDQDRLLDAALDHRRRRGPPRLRLPLRERRVRGRGRGRGPGVHRPDSRADPALRGQGLGAGARGRGRRSAARRIGGIRRPRRSRRARPRRRLPAAGEERRRRRRDRHARLPRRRASFRRWSTRAMRQSEQAFGSRACSSSGSCSGPGTSRCRRSATARAGCVVLGERDCSTQRRRQKVVEETPAPNLDDSVRAVLVRRHASPARTDPVPVGGHGRVRARRRLGRVRVPRGEHAAAGRARVTEAVTGVDLVEWMVRLAAGDADAMRSYVHAPSGHSIEVRVYAEDPVRDFRPSSGVVTEARLARRTRGSTPGCVPAPRSRRTTTRCSARSSCTRTRRESRDRMPCATRSTHTRIAGIETNRERRPVVRRFADRSADGEVDTESLAAFHAPSRTIEVLDGGSFTTVQASPGRVGFWHVGVPPSGPMDDRSFALGNEILGNPPDAAGLECTATGPTLRFDTDAVFCLTGARMTATSTVKPCRGSSRSRPVPVPRCGSARSTVPGCAPISTYGAASTWRRTSAAPPRSPSAASAATAAARCNPATCCTSRRSHDRRAVPGPVEAAPPAITSQWELGVVDGPHGAPDFFTDARPRDVLRQRLDASTTTRRAPACGSSGRARSGPAPTAARPACIRRTSTTRRTRWARSTSPATCRSSSDPTVRASAASCAP